MRERLMAGLGAAKRRGRHGGRPLSVNAEDLEQITAALDAGASGFVVKDTPASQLAEAVRRVHRGLRVVDPALAEESLFTPDSPLTGREVEVCHAARGGTGIREIAAELHLSQGTVRNHLSSVIGKTGASNRFEAVTVADQNGWL